MKAFKSVTLILPSVALRTMHDIKTCSHTLENAATLIVDGSIDIFSTTLATAKPLGIDYILTIKEDCVENIASVLESALTSVNAGVMFNADNARAIGELLQEFRHV